MTEGIYTLANDAVYDQLVALLNSIEVNVAKDFPVCVIPYDDRLEKVKQELSKRKNVQLLEDQGMIEKWNQFVADVWNCSPQAKEEWNSKGIQGIYRSGVHHRYCGFDESSPFDKFIYCDADIIILESLQFIFKQLDQSDFVVYDFQYKDLSHVYNINSQKLLEVFAKDRIDQEIFCSGFYGSKRGLFLLEKRQWLIQQLGAGEGEILYAYAPDQTILNYMVMRSNLPFYNFAFNLPPDQKTGNSVTSPHFQEQNHLVYDQGKPLTYLHYIGVPSSAFTRLCAGENLQVPYRETFLYYRYLHEPEKMPHFTGKPKPYNPSPSLGDRILKKLSLKR